MHSPTRLAGIFCGEHCPCCNPAVAGTVPGPGKPLQAPLMSGDGVIAPEAPGGALANAGARSGAFNRPKPYGKAFDRYLGKF
jgi:hypothetical protein